MVQNSEANYETWLMNHHPSLNKMFPQNPSFSLILRTLTVTHTHSSDHKMNNIYFIIIIILKKNTKPNNTPPTSRFSTLYMQFIKAYLLGNNYPSSV